MASIEGAAPTQTEDDTPSLIELFQCPIETLCDFGDIILVCNDDFHPQLKIRVSSCILANSSNVFRALFSERFAEGHAVHTGETNEIHVVETPRVFLVMCSLLHHSTIDESKTPVVDLLELALLIDKYDCVKPLKSASCAMLQILLEPLANHYCVDETDYLHVATAAYIMDQPEAFVQSTKKLLRSYEGQHGALDGRCVDLLPPTFFAAFQTQRADIFSKLTLTITHIVHEYTIAAHRNRKPNLVLDLMTNLSNLALWPLDAKITSLDKALSGLANLRIPVLVAAEDRPYSPPYVAPIKYETISGGNGDWADTQSVRGSRLNSWGEPVRYLPSPRTYCPTPLVASPFVDTLTPQDINAERAQLERSCVGLCIDCLKGNEVCRVERLGFCERWQKPAPITFSDPWGTMSQLEEW
ncbi:hypothetical protein B0A48_03793 [Cryoendolithus antarcticus]|uniref:BTB domain-containing protein n=1 Tax=Cryoendolithus antarcticus TaxID=1507870 RepID=A0A1V8TGI8_9PEZI|nr:hypothetical protein B0A48_03793 [Cryoendolithus antarcticus]